MHAPAINVEQINLLLNDCSAQQIIDWVHNNASSPVVSTSFGPDSAVLLHMVTQVMPGIPVIWVDSGYNTTATYRFALDLIKLLKLNIKIYTPNSTTAFLNVKMSGIPQIDTDAHSEFTQTIKLEPFNRALDELKPDMWLTGIRAEETSFRKTLDILTILSSGRVKLAPILNWNEKDISHYIEQFNLPVEKNYFDPTKPSEGAECGLHTRV